MFQSLVGNRFWRRMGRPALATAFALLLTSSPAVAMDLPDGKLPLLNTLNLSVDKLNGLAGGEGAVALSRLTIHYKFDLLLGEPVMSFRGNYDFRPLAIVAVPENCWKLVREKGLEGMTAAASPYVRIDNSERFRAAFAEAELLSDSTFSVRIVPNQKIVLSDRRLDVTGMHVQFRPDTLKRSLELGMMVSSSPSWDRVLQRKDGSFYSEAEAKAVFKVGFEVEGLELVELDYNVNALRSAARDYCREALAAEKTAETAKQEAPPATVSALENALESAFGGEETPASANSRNSQLPQSETTAGASILEDAFASVEESRAKRLKIEALKNSSDQFLGVTETPSRILRVLAQDHGSEDGDMVTIFLNNAEVLTFTLANATRQIDIPLQQGENVLEIKALNQGSSGKNTALFWVETEDGKELVRREWNLSSGGNAKLLVIRI